MTIRRRLVLAFSTILVLFALNQGIQLWVAQQRTQTMTTLDRALKRQVLLASLTQRIADLHKQTSLLGQIEVEPGDKAPGGNESINADINRAAIDIASLASLTDPADRPAITELQQTYATLAENWRRFYDYLGVEQGWALAFQVKAEPLGRRVVIQTIPQLQKQQAQRVTEAEARFARVTGVTEQVGLAIFVSSLFVAGSVAFLLARYLTNALSQLSLGAAIIGMQVEHRIAIPVKDEIGSVARALNDMAANLGHERAMLTTANSELATRNGEIERQRHVAETLLLNILPQQVADELLARGEVAPRYFEDVTIMFTDFVGFTLAIEKLAAEEVVSVLHGYFKKFDEIAARYHLEKLKTIGDSYFCVGGLPVRTSSHAVDATLAAFEMIREVGQQVLPNGDRWAVRIGLNTGPVVAGVVGTTKFAFDVWGETVNLASRMETAAEPNRINVSAAIHRRVKDFFVMENRGRILTKEQKEVEMYSVIRVLPNLITGDEVPPPLFAQRYRNYFDKDLTAFPAFLLDPRP